MTERTEAPIIAMRPDGPPVKTEVDWSKALKWYTPIIYTLEDGTEIPSKSGPFDRKKDAISHNEARDGITNMAANFLDGRFIGTRTSFRIGG